MNVRTMNMQVSSTVNNSVSAASAIAVLLRDLIDYAGLFPPAVLDMATAVANYDTYLHSEWNWTVGRFIVPSARLREFESAFAGLPNPASGAGSTIWRLSVLLGSDPAADVARICEFNARVSGSHSGRRPVVESVEVKVAGEEEIARLSGMISAELAVHFEIPLSSCAECVAAVAGCGRRAKIRTGGETADKFPTAEGVVEFIRLCAASSVPFKATAGLHHPLRSVHRLTYEADSPSGMMHGFLNLFLVASFLRAGMDAELAVRLLEEQSPDAFKFDGDQLGWRGHWLSHSEVADARRSFAVSFGSCSFTEPIEDLRSLGLL